MVWGTFAMPSHEKTCDLMLLFSESVGCCSLSTPEYYEENLRHHQLVMKPRIAKPVSTMTWLRWRLTYTPKKVATTYIVECAERHDQEYSVDHKGACHARWACFVPQTSPLMS